MGCEWTGAAHSHSRDEATGGKEAAEEVEEEMETEGTEEEGEEEEGEEEEEWGEGDGEGYGWDGANWLYLLGDYRPLLLRPRRMSWEVTITP